MRICFFVSLITFSINAHCVSLPTSTPVPGGVVVIPLLPIDSPQPIAAFGSQRIMVVKDKRSWFGIVGISRNQIPGEYIVTTQHNKSLITSFNFRVHARRFDLPTQPNNKRPAAEMAEDERNRWNLEKQKLLEIMSNWTKKSSMDLILKYPVTGSLITRQGSCGFGVKTALKIDGFSFAAADGTNLRAPTAATVVATGDFTVPGKTIVLDHGQGMFSMMCYLKDIVVKKGQRVAKGVHLANLGVTPRTAESKTDWIVMLNGSWVDPGIFIAK